MRQFRTVWTTGVLAVVLGVMMRVSLAAQGEEGFVPLKPGETIGEQLPAAPLVFAAYAAVWVLLLVYVYSLWRRISRVERELAAVTAKLEVRRP